MADVEKVFAELTMLADRRNDSTCEGAKCCEIAEDALELLKEQQELDRCKDCKHGRICENPILGTIVDCNGTIHSLDWFCADGKHK